MTEQKAIAQMKRGDIKGLKVLVNRYQVQAVRAAYLITRDRTSAEDIVQSAFLRAYERIHQFDSGRPFGPWFLRSVVNAALKTVAQQKRQISLEAVFEEADTRFTDLLADVTPGPADQAEMVDTRRRVWAALGSLTPIQRAAIVQRYYLGLSEAEMADQSNCPPGTIKWRLHAARERLRTLLDSLRSVEIKSARSE